MKLLLCEDINSAKLLFYCSLLKFHVQRSAKVFVRGCEKFHPALAYLFCQALPGSCLARFAYFLADLCIGNKMSNAAAWHQFLASLATDGLRSPKTLSCITQPSVPLIQRATALRTYYMTYCT